EQGYLLERWSLRVLPSADLLSLLPAARPGHGDSLLILGNPDLGDSGQDLPAAEQEARDIAAQTGSTRLRLRRAASESLFRAEAPAASA
ncbi:CHAT domain-containing protein, partial [Acinetobacter baumannii]